MSAVATVLLAATVASWAYWLVAAYAVRRHLRAPAPLAPPALPPVSILKPVRGVDAGARACFESFLRQEYPALELVFGVADPDDPVLPLLHELRREHPGEVRVVVAPAPGPNRKASLLAALAREARHDVLVATDSDMRVGPTWLRDVVAALSSPGAGLVTCPYRGEDPRSVAAALEALHIGVTFLPSALVASGLLGMPFGMGSTLALRRADLEAIGGFGALAPYLADDYQLAARVAALGRRVVVSPHVVSTVLGATTLRESWDREVRWTRCARVSQPAGHLGYAITFSTPLALAALAATGASPAGWAALAGSLAVRWTVAATVAHATGNAAARRALPLLPARDLLTAAVWVVASAGRRVVWRGDAFRVDRSGRLSPVIRAGAPAPATEAARAAGSRAPPAAR